VETGIRSLRTLKELNTKAIRQITMTETNRNFLDYFELMKVFNQLEGNNILNPSANEINDELMKGSD